MVAVSPVRHGPHANHPPWRTGHLPALAAQTLPGQTGRATARQRRIDVRGQHVHVIVVHLGLIGASRVRQVQRLQQFIDREVPHGAPLLVAGDFNDWSQNLG